MLPIYTHLDFKGHFHGDLSCIWTCKDLISHQDCSKIPSSAHGISNGRGTLSQMKMTTIMWTLIRLTAVVGRQNKNRRQSDHLVYQEHSKIR